MKELSVEEKSKRYDEKLDAAKHIYADPSVKDEDKYYLEVIFPELAESDDERIRKALIELVRMVDKNPIHQIFGYGDIKYSDMITWLEKQGEKGTNGNKGEFPIPELPLTIKHAKEVLGIEQKPAWSEEDEKMLEAISQLITDSEKENGWNCVYCNDKEVQFSDIIDWFKSLKDRVQPQPKQEWSEVDENHVKSILSTIECCKAQFPNAQAVVEAYNADIEWLNSLRPQNTWKPSDEQIEALHDTIIYVKDSMFPSKNVLKKLYRQLKKLKEE